MLEDIFALGAANGKSILFKRLLMTGCFGNLTAKLFFFICHFVINHTITFQSENKSQWSWTKFL